MFGSDSSARWIGLGLRLSIAESGDSMAPLVYDAGRPGIAVGRGTTREEGAGLKRRHLVELEDLPWWPRVFRDAATDYLVTALRHVGTYSGLAPRLAAAL